MLTQREGVGRRRWSPEPSAARYLIAPLRDYVHVTMSLPQPNAHSKVVACAPLLPKATLHHRQSLPVRIVRATAAAAAAAPQCKVPK